jgi:hypothetical protein
MFMVGVGAHADKFDLTISRSITGVIRIMQAEKYGLRI